MVLYSQVLYSQVFYLYRFYICVVGRYSAGYGYLPMLYRHAKIHGIIQYIIGYEIEGDLLDRYPAWYFMGWSLAREVGCMPRLLSLACS